MPRVSLLILCLLFSLNRVSAQDAPTGAIHGSVLDSTGSRIAQATIAVVNTATSVRYSATSDAEGRFAIDLLPPATIPLAPSPKACRRR